MEKYSYYTLKKGSVFFTGFKNEFMYDNYIFCDFGWYGNHRNKLYKIILKRDIKIILLAKYYGSNGWLHSTIPELWNLEKHTKISDKLDITQNCEKMNDIIKLLKNMNVEGFFSSLEDHSFEEFCFFPETDCFECSPIEKYNFIQIFEENKDYNRILMEIKEKIKYDTYPVKDYYKELYEYEIANS